MDVSLPQCTSHITGGAGVSIALQSPCLWVGIRLLSVLAPYRPDLFDVLLGMPGNHACHRAAESVFAPLRVCNPPWQFE